MDKGILETIPDEHPDKEYKIEITCPEFTCLCPDKRDQPDFATMIITYIPNEFLVELKSLKYYIVNYRDKEIYHEDATNRLLDDLVDTVDPLYMHVKGDWNIRGGIKTIVETEYVGEGWEGDPSALVTEKTENTGILGKNS